MWLSDYKEAIEAMETIFGNCCFAQIQCSFDGERIIFCTGSFDNLERYVYYKKTRTIIKEWRNPDHIEIIKEGDK